MKSKTQDLNGPALDWAVAKSKGIEVLICAGLLHTREDFDNEDLVPVWQPSTDWSQAGPIIEREGIELLCNVTAEEAKGFCEGSHADWRAAQRPIGRNARSFGVTPLIAAMRCFVAAKLGPEVEIPDELVALMERPAEEPHQQQAQQRPRSCA